MALIWLLAKYVPDIARREPRNVGLFLYDGDELLKARFIGENDDEVIDARVARFAKSSDNYKAWVRHWRMNARTRGELLRHASDDSYYVEIGGERWFGDADDWESNFSQLYGHLVEEVKVDSAVNLQRAAEKVLKEVGLSDRVERDVVVPVQDDDKLKFNYRFTNGVTRLMHRVTLVFEDDRSWDMAHAAAYAFDKALAAISGAKAIALVRGKSSNAADFGSQVKLLSARASVVDLGRDSAAEDLRRALH